MPTYHTPRYGAIPLALVAGALATSGALAILLQDAIRTGHWTIEHGLIPVLMAVQILTGHLFVAAARQDKILPALGFALVAAVATWGVLDTSVAKQGAVQAEAAAAAEDINDRRAAIERAVADAEAMLAPCPAGAPKADFGNRCSLRAAAVAECASGNGRRCQGKTASLVLYEGALKSHLQDLAGLGPRKDADARSENMATLLAALTGRDKATIKHVLATVRPFTYALIFELAALVSFGFAFGHRKPSLPSARDSAQTDFPRLETVAANDDGNGGNGGGNGGNRLRTAYTRDAASETLAKESCTSAFASFGRSISVSEACTAARLTRYASGEEVSNLGTSPLQPVASNRARRSAMRGIFQTLRSTNQSQVSAIGGEVRRAAMSWTTKTPHP